MQTFGFAVACIVVPIVWGVLVNWLFDLWKKRKDRPGNEADEPVFSDYQI